MDHLSVPVSDLAASQRFYAAALAPLGWSCSGWREDVYAGFKKPGTLAFYLSAAARCAPVHLAFCASTRAEVRAFFDAALAVGGVDNGPPGPRAAYGPDYYAAFVLDMDGHNVEAVVGGVSGTRPPAG